MSETIESLRNKIERAGELESVVRTMKALAASSIGEYENSVRALVDYYRTVALGWVACLDRENKAPLGKEETSLAATSSVVVFGSDQGLVGQFNDSLADFVAKSLSGLFGSQQVWAVGERMQACLLDRGLPIEGRFEVPTSIHGINPLVGQILKECTANSLYIFHNRPTSDIFYEPVVEQLLPLENNWRHQLKKYPWPTTRPPQVLGNHEQTIRSFVREYLFVSVFRSCAESLASENGSRLAAMQRAEKNIEEWLQDLKQNFHRMRQDAIDEELFDVISGFEAFGKKDEDGNAG